MARIELRRLKNLKKAEILERLHRFTFRPEFQPEAIRGSSRAAYSLSTWCIAMQVYGKVTLELFGQDSP